MSTKANGTPDYGSGYLEISEKGFGFLRSAENHFQPKPTDIFVTPDTIEERIAEVLARKRELFNELLEQHGPPPSLGLTEDEIFGLFDIQARPKRLAA